MNTLMQNILLLIIAIAVSGCGNDSKGTSTGNPLVNLRYAAFNSSLKTQMSPFALTQAKICFKRLRFKLAGEPTNSTPDFDEDNIDFSIGEKTLISSGDHLGDVQVPSATYARIEFDLDNSCGKGYSVAITNGSGSFATSDRISIKFQGNFVLTNSTSIELVLQNFITELNAVTNSSQIKSRLESASGTF